MNIQTPLSSEIEIQFLKYSACFAAHPLAGIWLVARKNKCHWQTIALITLIIMGGSSGSRIRKQKHNERLQVREHHAEKT